MNEKIKETNGCPNLLDSIAELSGAGAATAEKFKKLGIFRVYDLIHHYPARYLDFSKVAKIGSLKLGDQATIIGRVKDIAKISPRSGLKILKVTLFDGTGYISAVWFNQGYIAQKLRAEELLAISGKVDNRYGGLQIQNPLYDLIDEDLLIPKGSNTAAIVPIHPATSELSALRIRKIIKNLLLELCNLDDYLPAKLKKKFDLIDLYQAVYQIHFPADNNLLKRARDRLLFDELFLLQLAMLLRKKRLEIKGSGIKHEVKGGLLTDFLASLPFELTGDQLRVIEEIKRDMANSSPMNRLLQGEVGSGKTIVALVCLVISVMNGHQGALMVPTEILSKQHYLKLNGVLSQIGIKSACLTGSLTEKERAQLVAEIKRGDVDIVFGTHALIQDNIEFHSLGAIIVDEQHRFGVEQRLALKFKGDHPDTLVMTATPIPRSLSLTLYGDQEISSIRERPGSREIASFVRTYVVSEGQREKAYLKVISELKKGRQAYIICPLIEESDKLALKSVSQEVDYLANKVFFDFKVAVIHGRLKPKEKDKVMEDFKLGRTDVLISTTVIEVGIDVPNATVILIEDADRFGLSQLHQLRGRVGRGTEKSFCILFSKLNSEESKARMKAIKELSDGFSLAEQDLIIRGQGEFFGTRQSGRTDLKLVKLPQDFDLLTRVRAEAEEILAEDPGLIKAKNRPLLDALKIVFFDNLDWLLLGQGLS